MRECNIKCEVFRAQGNKKCNKKRYCAFEYDNKAILNNQKEGRNVITKN